MLPLLAMMRALHAEDGAPAPETPPPETPAAPASSVSGPDAPPSEPLEDEARLPLPDWEPRPPGGAYAVGRGINRASVYSGAGALGGAALGGTFMLVGDYGGLYSLGAVLLVTSAGPAILATPGVAVGPLISCHALRRAGATPSCAAGTVSVALLGAATVGLALAATETDLNGAPAFVSLATVPAIWMASAVQVQVNQKHLELSLASPAYRDRR